MLGIGGAAPSEDRDIERNVQRCRNDLAQALALADDDAFLGLIWALNALQSGNREIPSLMLRGTFPEDATTGDMSSKAAIYKWELETLANELLATPKHPFYRIVDCGNWQTVAKIVNTLRRLEDVEYQRSARDVPILREMYRIAGRQFEWQHGVISVQQFYRSAFIFGQGSCAEYFASTHGITIADMTLIGFGLYAGLIERPGFGADADFSMLGATNETRDQVVRLISAPLAAVRQLAAKERSAWEQTAYRPSILRRFPCIGFGRHGWRIRAPLPELIIDRVTSGLFYDVIGGGGPIRAEYGRRFQEYAERFIQATLPTLPILPEWHYRVSGQRVDSPDIMLLDTQADEIAVAIECKASRMSFAARFKDDAGTERGYDDLAKAVFQIWRFFAHCRRGLTGMSVTEDALGVVLTLDSWLVMGMPLQEDVMRRAVEMSRHSHLGIEDEDRRPIIFCSMPDMEATLLNADATSFLRTLKIASVERQGWYLRHVHRDFGERSGEQKPYPFDDLERYLPWWGAFGESSQRRDDDDVAGSENA